MSIYQSKVFPNNHILLLLITSLSFSGVFSLKSKTGSCYIIFVRAASLSSAYLCSNIHQLLELKHLSIVVTKEIQQTSLGHQLCDDVDGFHVRAHGIQSDQLIMLTLLHDISLLQEGILWHCSWLECFYGNICAFVPFSCWEKKHLMHLLIAF